MNTTLTIAENLNIEGEETRLRAEILAMLSSALLYTMGAKTHFEQFNQLSDIIKGSTLTRAANTLSTTAIYKNAEYTLELSEESISMSNQIKLWDADYYNPDINANDSACHYQIKTIAEKSIPIIKFAA